MRSWKRDRVLNLLFESLENKTITTVVKAFWFLLKYSQHKNVWCYVISELNFDGNTGRQSDWHFLKDSIELLYPLNTLQYMIHFSQKTSLREIAA